MSNFKKLCVTFSILKLQKSDAYQNGVEFRHKANGNDVKGHPLLFFLPPPLPRRTKKDKKNPVVLLKPKLLVCISRSQISFLTGPQPSKKTQSPKRKKKAPKGGGGGLNCKQSDWAYFLKQKLKVCMMML